MHVTAVVGATESTLTTWDFSALALPATSVEKYHTVFMPETVNGPVYTVAVGLVTGSLPSVV